MHLTMEDRNRIWRALASYVQECETLATESETDSSDYYQSEIEKTRLLRAQIRRNQE
jgi:hypothetical protein